MAEHAMIATIITVARIAPLTERPAAGSDKVRWPTAIRTLPSTPSAAASEGEVSPP